MNNVILQLDTNINAGWEQLRGAAKVEDITTAQNAIGRISHLLNLKSQQLNLEKSIAASIAGDGLPTPVPAKNGGVYQGKRSTVRPTEIRFGTFKKALRYAYEIPMAVANWLLEQGKALPTIPNFIHPSKTGFSKSANPKQLVSGQWIEIGDDQKVLMEKARKVFDACGYQGMKFEVSFEDGSKVTG